MILGGLRQLANTRSAIASRSNKWYTVPRSKPMDKSMKRPRLGFFVPVLAMHVDVVHSLLDCLV